MPPIRVTLRTPGKSKSKSNGKAKGTLDVRVDVLVDFPFDFASDIKILRSEIPIAGIWTYSDIFGSYWKIRKHVPKSTIRPFPEGGK